MPIVIIGGGVIGSAIAYFLTLQQPGCDVVVVERDPTYQAAEILPLRPNVLSGCKCVCRSSFRILKVSP